MKCHCGQLMVGKPEADSWRCSACAFEVSGATVLRMPRCAKCELPCWPTGVRDGPDAVFLCPGCKQEFRRRPVPAA